MGEEEKIDFGRLTSYSSSASSGGSGVKSLYGGDTWFVTVRLSDLFGAELCSHECADGEERRGIFLPFLDAGLTVTPKRNVLATFRMEPAQIPSGHHTHLLTQVVDNDIVAERRRDGFRHEYAGFARPAWTNGKQKKGKI